MPRYPKALVMEFTVYDKVLNRLRRVKRKGRLFVVGGVTVKLFEIRILCEAIDRTHRTVTNWERAGKFPKPMFQIPNSRCKRWYSEAQIRALNELWLKYRGKGKGRHFPLDQFLTEIAECFYKVDVELLDQEKEAASG